MLKVKSLQAAERVVRWMRGIAGIVLIVALHTRYITGYLEVLCMGSSQQRAIQNYRTRLGERGLARFEVLGRETDRDLIRTLARRLAEEGPDASRLRAAVSQSIAGDPPKTGGILAALRRCPLVGADLDLRRPREDGRSVEI